jgi:ATP-binding cassette subfamily B protein
MKRIIEFSGEYKKGLLLAFLLSFLFTSFDVLAYYGIVVTLKYVVLAVKGGGAIELGHILHVVFIMVVSLTGKLFFGSLANSRLALTSFNICNKKRIDIGNRLKKVPMGCFKENKLGHIASTVTTAINDIESTFSHLFTKIIVGLFHASLITLVLCMINPPIGLIALLALISGLVVNMVLQKQSKIVSPKRQNAQHQLVTAVLEYVQGIGVIKAFGLGEISTRRLGKAIDDSCHKNIGLEKVITKILSFYVYTFKIFSSVLVVVAADIHINGSLDLYNFLVILVSSFIIFSSIENLGGAAAFIQMIDVNLDKIESIDNMPLLKEGLINTPIKTFDIKFENVDFSYGQEQVIKGVNLEIKEGETVAIVGPSGSGKSTLCHLLARFWEVDQGSIQVGGQNVNQLNYDYLMEQIGIVFQKVYLFEDTILNNIKFAKPEASLEGVYDAAKKACCHDFIMSLPQGYQTIVKEGGQSLSGGERQRIAIARAILKDAPIVILDEATSSVDPINEVMIHKGVEALTTNKTVIMVAHQLSTIKTADQIVVLKDGEIVQRGNHEGLMRDDGLYRSFVEIKTRAYNWQL